MEFYEGDIFRATMNNGAEKEFVILSVHNDFSTVLMLSDNEELPYSVKCGGMKYTNPGMLSYVFNDKFTTLIRSLKKDEYDDLMQEVVEGLGFEAPVKEIVKEAKPAHTEWVRQGQIMVPETEALKADLTKAQAERDVYKSLYENLLNSMMSK